MLLRGAPMTDEQAGRLGGLPVIMSKHDAFRTTTHLDILDPIACIGIPFLSSLTGVSEGHNLMTLWTLSSDIHTDT